MTDNQKITYSAGGGVGFFTILFFIFLILKLTNTISWSWWIVFLPLYLPYVVGLVFMLLVFGIMMLVYKLQKNRRY
jgi:ABC-type antimicrobial peptide transport system permease subunit